MFPPCSRQGVTEDLSHGLVLTAEFKPFQEVDVMAKVGIH